MAGSLLDCLPYLILFYSGLYKGNFLITIYERTKIIEEIKDKQSKRHILNGMASGNMRVLVRDDVIVGT